VRFRKLHRRPRVNATLPDDQLVGRWKSCSWWNPLRALRPWNLIYVDARGDRFLIAPPLAEAIFGRLHIACRCGNCAWKEGLSDAEIARQIQALQHDYGGLVVDDTEEIKALEP